MWRSKKIWGVLALVAGVAIALVLTTASSAATKDVKKGNTSLGTILVNKSGLSLYRLSGEKKGHFICTGSCTQLWKPLHPRKGKTPTGVSNLSVLKRPDGTKQIAYKGHPLYRFAQDSKPGDVKGQGFKDVGTWSVIKVKAPAPTTTQQTQTSTTNTGGGYTYPGY
jgi:predicted lipoprotein with Yx(FWY)xxD motif